MKQSLFVFVLLALSISAFAGVQTTEIICSGTVKESALKSSEVMILIQREFPSNLRTMSVSINGNVQPAVEQVERTHYTGAMSRVYDFKGNSNSLLGIGSPLAGPSLILNGQTVSMELACDKFF